MALWNTPMYRRWYNIKSRCTNPNNEKWDLYGGRGIQLCERWQDFEAFALDMGPQPSASHTVDRLDVNGPYSPENCRWATPVEQANNKRCNILLDGLTLAQQARRLGVTPETIRYRIATGADPLTPHKRRKKNYGRTVLQIRSDGSVVRRHESLAAAANSAHPENPNAALKAIWRVLESQRKSYLGYSWVYAALDASE
jgi:hypothetical protein